jgi:hypothetical protein
MFLAVHWPPRAVAMSWLLRAFGVQTFADFAGSLTACSVFRVADSWQPIEIGWLASEEHAPPAEASHLPHRAASGPLRSYALP